MNEQELREQIAQEIEAYSIADNTADVGTKFERCLCDASICIHYGYSRAAAIARGKNDTR